MHNADCLPPYVSVVAVVASACAHRGDLAILIPMLKSAASHKRPPTSDDAVNNHVVLLPYLLSHLLLIPSYTTQTKEDTIRTASLQIIFHHVNPSSSHHQHHLPLTSSTRVCTRPKPQSNTSHPVLGSNGNNHR